MPLDPQAQVIIDLIESMGFGEMGPMTDPVELRTLMDQVAVPSGVTLDSVTEHLAPGAFGAIPVRVYRPAGDAPKPLIVYYHGGGWVLGSLTTHDGICRGLAAGVDAVVASVDYRLAPEHRFPAAVEDAQAALAWAVGAAASLGADGSRLVVAGDSAGGNIAAVMAHAARTEGPEIAFQLLVYPVTDHEFTSASMEENATGYYLTREMMRWFYGLYLNHEGEAGDPRVSPLRATDLAGLPPAYVMTAEYDPLRDQGRAYASAMAAAGVRVETRNCPGLFHGFFSLGAQIDAAQAEFDRAVAAVRAAVA